MINRSCFTVHAQLVQMESCLVSSWVLESSSQGTKSESDGKLLK